jgi:hypothetical protein
MEERLLHGWDESISPMEHAGKALKLVLPRATLRD